MQQKILNLDFVDNFAINFLTGNNGYIDGIKKKFYNDYISTKKKTLENFVYLFLFTFLFFLLRMVLILVIISVPKFYQF